MADLKDLRGVPINALRTFEAAARRLSFSEAATELGVTASAVSIQIRRLEARIGRPLFVRGHRSVALTPMGARLAEGLTQIFGDLDRLLQETVAPARDSLVISAMPSFATKWLAPRLAAFNASHPGLAVRIVGADALADFDRDGIDIGIRYGAGLYPGLHVEKLAPARAFPVCSPAFRDAHAESLGDATGLAQLRLIHDETSLRAPGLPSWAGWCAVAGAQPPPRTGPVYESLHMALTAAAAGQGIALGLTPVVDEDLRSGVLVQVLRMELVSPHSFWFVCRRDGLRDRRIRAFRDWIARSLSEG